uniref:NAD(P)-dependent oxidoreductase n=1 Tax=Steinernema glaseri TaxID=37863 RepID=A0A1I7Y1I3_9BILA
MIILKETHAMTPSIQPKHYEPGSSQKVAFIGLGVMGYPMAGHLAQAGHHVTVYNRNQAKAEQWSAEFKQAWAATPAQAAAQADIVMACVGNDDDLRAIFQGADGALAGMKAGSLFIDHTTASAEVARELGALAASKQVTFVDAPISGGQAGAQKGMLSIMCGGQTEDMERARPLMMSYAQACTLMGPLGSGQLCKMVNQIAVVGLLQGLAEAMAFGERAGLDMEQALSVLTKGAARSWQMETKGPTMLARDFQPGFTVNWMLKDLDLVER